MKMVAGVNGIETCLLGGDGILEQLQRWVLL
jgi:hypothetical protein